jgi:hypothetical protein
MARIRTIKPEFWIDEKIVDLSAFARLLFIGMWNFADDQGFIDYKPRRIKMQVFPADDVDVQALLDELLAAGRVVAHLSPIGPVLRIVNWHHQRVDKPARERFAENELQPFIDEPPRSPDPSPQVRSTSESPREVSPNGRESSGASVATEGKGSGSGSGRDQDQTPSSRAPSTMVDAEAIEDRPPLTARPRDHPPLPLPIDIPSAALAVAETPNAGIITAQWIDHCAANGVKLTKNLIGRYAKGIKHALDQQFDPNLIKRALAQMLDDRETSRPGILDGYLVRVQQGPARRPRRLTPGEESAANLAAGNAVVIDLASRFFDRDAS